MIDPIPETDDTLQSQLQMVLDKRKKALLLTPGESLGAIPKALSSFPVSQGTFIYDPEQTNPAELFGASKNDTIGDVLGYRVSKKPDNPTGVVTLRDAHGVEKQSVVVDDKSVRNAFEMIDKIAGPSDKVGLENPQDVIARRFDPSLDNAFSTIDSLTVKQPEAVDFRDFDQQAYQNTMSRINQIMGSGVGMNEAFRTADKELQGIQTSQNITSSILQARGVQQEQQKIQDLGPVLGQMAESRREESISPGESFASAIKASGLLMAKGIINAGTALGFPEPSEREQQYLNAETAIAQSKSVGLTGLLGEQVPALVLAATNPEIGLLVFFVSDFGDKMKRMEDTDINPFLKYLMGVGWATADVGAFLVGGRATTQEAISGQAAEQIGRTFIRDGAKGALKEFGKHVSVDLAKNVGVMDAVASLDYAVGNWMLGEDRDYLKELEHATASGAIFAGAGGIATGIKSGLEMGRLSKPGILAERLMNEGTVTRQEAEMVNYDPKTVLQISDARQRGDIVHLDTYEDVGGKEHVMVKTEKDIVPWEVKQAFQNDPVAIDLIRTKIKNGESVPLFTGRDVGPVGLDELQGVEKKLDTLAGRIKLEDTDQTKDGTPLTRRALLQGDVEFIKQALQDGWSKPDGRRIIEIAKNLVDTANKDKLYDSTKGFPPNPDVAGPRTTVLTPLNPNPAKLEFIATKATQAGLMKPSTELTDNIRNRKIIDRLKTGLINDLSVVNGKSNFSAPEAWALSRKLEETYMDRVRQVLAKDENNSKGTRKQVVKEIVKTASLEEQPSLIKFLDDKLTEINRSNSNMTQRETLARLIEDLQGFRGERVRYRVGTGNTPSHIMEMLQDLYKKMESGGPEYKPWSSRVRDTLAKTNELTQDLLKTTQLSEDAKRAITKLPEGLPQGSREELMNLASKARSREEYQKILDTTRQIGEEFVRRVDSNKVRELAKRLDTSPRKQEGLELLRAVGDFVGGKVARAASIIGWHGTPHEFPEEPGHPLGRFRTDKIGTGEGAQAFGYGHYFASKQEVAEHYKKKLAQEQILFRGKSFNDRGLNMIQGWDAQPAFDVAQEMQGGSTFDQAKAYVKDKYQEVLRSRAQIKYIVEDYKEYLVSLDEFKPSDFTKSKPGKLYQVELSPNKDELLDWDKPFSQQSPKVQEALTSLGIQKGIKRDVFDPVSGQDIYNKISYELGSDKMLGPSDMQYGPARIKNDVAASQALRKAGIRGIKYLEGASRSKGEGAHNYVIFDDSDISIKSKQTPVAPGIAGLEKDLGLTPTKTPPKLTPTEESRLSLAQDGKAFNEISPAHKKLNEYWNEGVRLGVFSDGEALLLRYIFTEMSPKAAEKLTHLEFRREIPSREGGNAAGLHTRGEQAGDERSKIELSLPSEGSSRLHPFIHEYLHNGYYVFLDESQVHAVETAHAKLLAQPGEKPGETKAHDIIREISRGLDDKHVDYYARDPGEFFAEAGSRYLQEKKTSVPVLKKIWDGLHDRLTRYLVPFIADKRASRLLGPEFTDAVQKIIIGERGGEGPSRLQSEIQSGALEPTEVFAKEAKPAKSPVYRDAEDGKEKIDYPALTKALDKLSLDQVQDLKNRLAQIVRHGDIEKGVYKKYLKFSQEEDALLATGSLKGIERNALAQRVDKPLHIGKTLLDPVTMEGWLSQQGRNRTDAPLRNIFHENMVEGMSRHEMNVANTRRFVLDSASKILGIDAKGVRGQFQLSKYLAEKLEGGIRRGEAMWAYAMSTDPGRSADLKRVGLESRNKSFTADEAIKTLSARDKEFVDKTKEYFKDNPMIDNGFNRFTLLNGVEPTKYPHWFTSRRVYEPETLTPDFASWTNSFEKKINPLKERVEHSDQPFDVTGGYLDAFYDVADSMSKYGELAIPSMRAERLINNQEFRGKFTEQYGEARLNSLEVYLKHIMGKIGHRAQVWDHAANWFNSAWTVGKVGLNVVSAMKQALHIFTMLGDTNLDKGALSRAFAEQAGVNSGVGKRMREGSGLAYNRYDNGRFINAISLLSEGRGEPSKIKELQHYSMFLQRRVDDYVMRTAWRAAEIMAKEKGLKGQDFNDFVRRKFEVTAGRDQPTDNPLYSGEMELYAIRNPLARGALIFMREQNRIYNVMRRNVVKAVQEPTQANIKNAGYALLFAGVANGVMVSVFNNLRRAAFNKPAFLKEDIQSDAIQNLAGMWYLSGEAVPAMEAMFDSTKRYREGDNLQGPIASTFMNVIKASNAAHDLVASEDLQGKESLVSRGINRGEDKTTHYLKQAVDNGIDVISSSLGLPFWGLWYQGKGLYNWTKPEIKMMTELEVEKARLSKQPQANASSLLQIKRIQEHINKIHQRREKGYLSQEDAQNQIASVLKQRYGD